MTIEQLRKFYDAQPFKPFVMHLADGRAIPVMHREFMASAPSGPRSPCINPTIP